MKFLWEIEKIGFDINEGPAKNDVLEQFETTISQQASGRYEVEWPKKSPLVRLNSNKDKARCRLNAQWPRLKKDRELLGEFDDIFEGYCEVNIIEEAPEEEIINSKFATTYLPDPVVKL